MLSLRAIAGGCPHVLPPPPEIVAFDLCDIIPIKYKTNSALLSIRITCFDFYHTTSWGMYPFNIP